MAAASRRRAGLRWALIVLGFALAGLGGAAVYFAPVIAFAGEAAVSGQARHSPRARTPRPAQPAGGAAFTVLLLGSDNDAKFSGRPLTQSMILTRIDPSTRTVTMLSIPRDFYVPIWSGGVRQGRQKIMTAYGDGGAAAAEETIRRDFGVGIDAYVWIGLKGLVRMIDRLGGVDVVAGNPVMDDYYPNDIGTRNAYSYKRVAVLPGPQHMDGRQAMDYVRSRHSDPNGDLGRSARQQQVLVALRAKTKRVNPTEIPALLSSLNGELMTDLNLGRVAQLLPLARHLQGSRINRVVLSGYARTAVVGGQDVLIPNTAAVTAEIHRYFPAIR